MYGDVAAVDHLHAAMDDAAFLSSPASSCASVAHSPTFSQVSRRTSCSYLDAAAEDAKAFMGAYGPQGAAHHAVPLQPQHALTVAEKYCPKKKSSAPVGVRKARRTPPKPLHFSEGFEYWTMATDYTADEGSKEHNHTSSTPVPVSEDVHMAEATAEDEQPITSSSNQPEGVRSRARGADTGSSRAGMSSFHLDSYHSGYGSTGSGSKKQNLKHRQNAGDEYDSDSGDDKDGYSGKSRKDSSKESMQPLLDCPLRKAHPELNDCTRRGFPDTTRTREHLQRKHDLSKVCAICFRYHGKNYSGRCERRSQDREFLPEAKLKSLKEFKGKYGGDRRDNWKKLYRSVLGEDCECDPYFDPSLVNQFIPGALTPSPGSHGNNSPTSALHHSYSHHQSMHDPSLAPRTLFSNGMDRSSSGGGENSSLSGHSSVFGTGSRNGNPLNEPIGTGTSSGSADHSLFDLHGGAVASLGPSSHHAHAGYLAGSPGGGCQSGTECTRVRNECSWLNDELHRVRQEMAKFYLSFEDANKRMAIENGGLKEANKRLMMEVDVMRNQAQQAQQQAQQHQLLHKTAPNHHAHHGHADQFLVDWELDFDGHHGGGVYDHGLTRI